MTVPKPDSLRQLASQTAWYGLSTVVGRLLNYLLVPLHTRLFHPEAYGVITDFYALAAVAAVLYTYGMETAYFRFSGKAGSNQALRHSFYTTAFYSILVTSLLLGAVLWLGASEWASLLRHPDRGHFVQWFALIFGIDAVSALPFAKLRQEGRIGKFVGLKIATILILVGLQVYFLWLQPHAWGMDWVVLSNVLANGLGLVLLWKEFPDWKGFRLVHLGEMLAYAWPLLLAGLAGMLNETLDRILFKYRFPGNSTEVMAALGIYGAAYKLSVLMSLFTQAFRMGAEPYFLSKGSSSVSAPPSVPQKEPRFGEIFWYYSLAGWGIFLGVALWIDLAKWWIGPDFHSGLAIVPVLLGANLCLGWYYNHSVWYKRSDQTHYGMWLALGSALLTVLGNWFFVPLYGYWACAWTTLVAYASLLGGSIALSRWHHPIAYPWKAWLLLGIWAMSLFAVDLYWIGPELSPWTVFYKLLLLLGYGLAWPLGEWLNFVRPRPLSGRATL